jgi:PKD repeat protein
VEIAPAPTASFTFTPDYGAAPLPVSYTNASTGALAYQWYFGDGGYAEDENPVHTFTYNTDFITTLVATGPGGCKDTATATVTVNIATLDIAVVDIDVEKQNNRVRPFATIINQGTRNVSHYYLTATLGDGSRITERVDTLLLSGTGMIYYFVAGYEATEFQANSFLCIQASQPNEETDDNALNDRLCKPLENDIRIVPPFPNPASDVVTFEVLIPREAPLEITLYDVLGHKLQDIFNGPAEVGTTTFKLNLNGYARGMYIVRIKFNEDEYILKFVAD